MATGEAFYMVILEFPSESEVGEDLSWLKNMRSKVEEFCDEHSFKIGALRILPKPYFPFVERFLRKVKGECQEKGHHPTFKFLKATLQGVEYRDLQRLILDQTRSRLERCLTDLGKGLNERCVVEVSREVAKANELILIFQLNRAFPEEAVRLYDLISILNEKISDYRVKASEVVVTEI